VILRSGVVFGIAAVILAAPGNSRAQSREQARLIAQREQSEKELESIAIMDRKLMVPMRDGVRLATDVYRSKNAA
jgi:predicted acyl esterase